MELLWALTAAVGLLTTALAGGDAGQETPREIGYDSYDTSGYADSRWQYTPSSAPPSTDCGTPWRPLLTGVLLGALVKVPLLILGKVLLIKAAAPLAVVGALLPLGVFSVWRAVMSQASGGGLGGGNSTSRLLPQGCLEAAACGIGSSATKSAVASTSWLLKTLGDAVEKEWAAGAQVRVYREAYLKGATNKNCPDYPCPFF